MDEPTVWHLTLRERHLLCQALTSALDGVSLTSEHQEILELRDLRARLASGVDVEDENGMLQ